jgi:hypothetical protein
VWREAQIGLAASPWFTDPRTNEDSSEGDKLLKHAELGYFKTPMVSPGQFDFSGHGQNELTSYMDLEIRSNIVIGTYVSAVSETEEADPIKANLRFLFRKGSGLRADLRPVRCDRDHRGDPLFIALGCATKSPITVIGGTATSANQREHSK